MHYHFIAIGGSAMHNLALALHQKGDQISGSDDEIFEPSRSRLQKHGLLPEAEGWFPDNITSNLDAIVLGMHAKADNPELLRAQELGLKIYSYPEFLYEQTKNKKRVVIGGSHGKTTTTAMVLHVLQDQKYKFDYMVGAQLEGFETMVGFSDEADIAIFEGDEYLTSPIDPRPKFHLYQPHIALLTGIAWDHVNVFPTFENYVSQFSTFVQGLTSQSVLIYYKHDKALQQICKEREDLSIKAYEAHAANTENGVTYLQHGPQKTPLQIFGKHNLENLNGARLICNELGIRNEDFYHSIQNFKGAQKRLQQLAQTEHSLAFLDFAHSPSKLKATVSAVKMQYPDKKLIACMELHTYSSLKKEFLSEYAGAMDEADQALIYFDHHAVELKRLKKINKKEVAESFDKEGLEVFDDQKELKKALFFMEYKQCVLLFLSSGNFSGINLKEFAGELLEKDI